LYETLSLWYYKAVRRLAWTVALLIFASACGKKVPIASRSGGSSSTTSRVSSTEVDLQGLASYYAEPYNGRRTANGEVFNSYEDLTAAHRTLPFNTVVNVKNQTNGREVDVRINDRGPFIDGRVIDLSYKAAQEIDMVRAGVVPVKLVILKEATTGVQGASRGAGPPPPPAPETVYTIQVGAFASQDAAESLKRSLEQRYRDVSIQTFSTVQTFYRVRVGRLTDLDSAEKLSEQLREENFDPFVVRVN
jgi:rare lipoprotein A